MLEAARDNGGFSTVQKTAVAPTGGGSTSAKNKAEGMFTTFDHFDPESEDEVSTSAHVVAVHSNWIKPGSHYKFPCPLQNQDHEIAACLEFLTLTPKDRWLRSLGGVFVIPVSNLKEQMACAKLDSVPKRKQFPRFCCVLHSVRGLLRRAGHSDV